MKTFTLSVDLENAAFAHNREAELARILRDVMAKIEANHTFGHARDINGNRVGSWEISQ